MPAYFGGILANLIGKARKISNIQQGISNVEVSKNKESIRLKSIGAMSGFSVENWEKL